MRASKLRTDSIAVQPGLGGLVDADQRSLIRVIFLLTGVTLACFALLQFGQGNGLFALLEILAAALLFWGAWRIPVARRPVWWIVAYLLPLNGFIVYIIIMPDASVTAFVWVYMMPVMSYLLLGRLAGLLLAIPYMFIATLAYLQRFGLPDDAAGFIDLGNALSCGMLILVFVHLYERRRAAAQQALERMADTDALTGVANRGSFQRSLEWCIAEAARSQTSFVLVLLDVDLFKQVNDRWGHAVGDAALQHICRVLSARLRQTDSIGRLGGEEFGLLLRDADLTAARQMTETLRLQLNQTPLRFGQQSINLSATFGLAVWPTDGVSADALFRSADERLYRGKALGRNQLVHHDVLPVDILDVKLTR
ncbi:MAG: GGDEF domain-containing protein [Gammaproteobacteria bacterium HGW-Gammaproteobacteria-11]|nr:MAG: GGDEF domain-containing protein [Gammaproteobacteria bacterium HGW-Gammaproteobacteria-11]